MRVLGRHDIDSILGAAKSRRVSAKSVITYQGEPADCFILLWKGRARYLFETSNGKKLILVWITPGEFFGGAALAARPFNYLLSAEAVRNSVVLPPIPTAIFRDAYKQSFGRTAMMIFPAPCVSRQFSAIRVECGSRCTA